MKPQSLKPMVEYTVAELVPHAGQAVLLDEILSGDRQHAAAGLTVRADGVFDDGAGRVPAWVGIEYMAQTVALFGGYHRRCRNLPVTLGFLLGTRRFKTNTAGFDVGTRLETCARLVLMESSGLSVFECELRGPGILLEARLNTFQPDEVDQYLSEST